MSEDLPDVYIKLDDPAAKFKGECTDDKHPGEDGWITIKSFTFGFGFPGQDDAAFGDDDDDDTQAASGTTANGKTPAPKPKKKKKKNKSAMKSGPMTFDRITFTKSSDSTSHRFMQWCHEGKDVAKVELHACRWGGKLNEEKITFLQLTFEQVHLKSCKLNLATDNLPTEDIEFEFEKVHMNCLWTDNATGNRLTSQPMSAGWDLQGQKESLDEPPPDNDATLD